ncbi:MAG: YaaR family protein [Fusobacteriota bacterium]
MKISKSKGGGFKGTKQSSSTGNKAKKADQRGIPKQEKLNVNINHSPFVDKMNEVEMSFTKKELKATLKEIDELGRQLMRNPNMEKLEEYKKNIHAFFKEALQKMYKVEDIKGVERLGKEQKVYVNVTKIDEELEQMTLEFLKNQGESLNVISKVEHIQGLLYDIVA